MLDGESRSERSSGWRVLLVSIVLAVVLFFLPLTAAYVEYKAAGTSHVENAFRQMGVHDELSAIYEPVIRVLGLD